jgi:hypothetical protein
MKAIATETVRDTLAEQAAVIGKTFDRAKEHLLTAAKLVVEFVNATPDWINKIIPHIRRQGYGPTRHELLRLEKLGRGEILFEVMMGSEIGFHYLERISPSLQKKFLAEPLQLALVNDGKTVIYRLEVNQLSKTQCEQLFAPDRTVRSIEQQVEYLKTIKREAARPLFEARGDDVLCPRAFKVNKREVPRLIEELKKIAGV